MIKFYNTLTNKVEEFKPIKENNVSIYICGVTPYDVCHLGHARAYVTFDVIKRHFMRSGYTVNHVQNFTDVDSLQFFLRMSQQYPERFACHLDRECFHDLNGNTVGRRGVDYTQVPGSKQRELKGSGYRCGGKREGIDGGAQLAELFLGGNSELLLLIYHKQA